MSWLRQATRPRARYTDSTLDERLILRRVRDQDEYFIIQPSQLFGSLGVAIYDQIRDARRFQLIGNLQTSASSPTHNYVTRQPLNFFMFRRILNACRRSISIRADVRSANQTAIRVMPPASSTAARTRPASLSG